MTLPRSSNRSVEGRRSKEEGLIPVLVTRFSKSMNRAMRRSVETDMAHLMSRQATLHQKTSGACRGSVHEPRVHQAAEREEGVGLRLATRLQPLDDLVQGQRPRAELAEVGTIVGLDLHRGGPGVARG